MNRRNIIKTGILAGLATVVPSFGAKKLDNNSYTCQIWCSVFLEKDYIMAEYCYELKENESFNKDLFKKAFEEFSSNGEKYFSSAKSYYRIKNQDSYYNEDIAFKFFKFDRNNILYTYSNKWSEEFEQIPYVSYKELEKQFV